MSRQARFRWKIGVILFFFLGPTEPNAERAANTIRQTREYAICMRLARVSPEEGFESALVWSDDGGGDAAQHCAAVALYSMGQFREAAIRFHRLAQTIKENDAVRSNLLAQAGQAWHQAGDIDRAYVAYSTALNLTPNAPEIRVDRAIVLAERGRYEEAVDDLDVALDVNGRMVEALVLRASARRYLNALELALQDASRALGLSPAHPGALLERGMIARLQGRPEDARHDWLKILRLYDGTLAADTAKRNLEILDVTSQ